MALMLMSSSSFAAWGKKGNEGHPQKQGQYRMYDHLTEELDLTKAQIKQIKKIKIRYQKETLPIKTRIQELKIELKEALIEDELNKIVIKSILNRINKQEGKIKEKGVDRLFEITDIMTPEQVSKMKDLHLFNKFLGGRTYDKPYHRGKRGKERKQRRDR